MIIKFSQKIQIAIVYAVAVFLLAADRLMRVVAHNNPGLHLDFGRWLSFHFQSNTGIAFSWPINNIILAILLAATVFFILRQAVVYLKKGEYTAAMILIIIAAAALSNIVDRLIYGAVIDYLDCRFFVCNIADILISLFIGFLIIDLVFKPKFIKR